MVYGADFKSATQRIEIREHFEYDLDENRQLVALKFESQLNAPIVTTTVRIDGEYSRNAIGYTLEAGYDKYKVASNLAAKLNAKAVGDYDVVWAATINVHNVRVIARRTIDGDRSKIENKLTTSAGTRVELNGMVKNRPTPTDTDVTLDGVLVAADGQVPFK